VFEVGDIVEIVDRSNASDVFEAAPQFVRVTEVRTDPVHVFLEIQTLDSARIGLNDGAGWYWTRFRIADPLTVALIKAQASASNQCREPVTPKVKGQKMQKYKLAERAVLMRMSAGLPGKNRTDKKLTESVKANHSLGVKSGRWVKVKYPEWALEPLENLVTEARAFHAKVTLPFDAGIGILSAALIQEYGDRMRTFKGQFDHLVQSHFVPRYPEMVEWARAEHNGTFDPSDYPAVETLLDSFYFRTEPLPVPDAAHFEGTMSSLLGVDAEGVNIRVQDAMQEAQRELMARMIEPVRAMAVKLAEQPKAGKDDICFRDSLIGNIREIAELVPKLNIGGDAAIDQFAADMLALARYVPEVLRTDKAIRNEAQKLADATMKRLAGYNF
jgi:hypothetical protein